MGLVFADAADIAIERFVPAPGTGDPHCARCGAPRMLIWSAAGQQAVVVCELPSNAVRGRYRAGAAR